MRYILVWFALLGKSTQNFLSASFVIRVNLLHYLPSLFLYGLLLSVVFFFILVNYYFQASFYLKLISVLCGQNNSKYLQVICDVIVRAWGKKF